MSASKRGYTNQVNTGAVEFFSHNFKNFFQPYGKAYIQRSADEVENSLTFTPWFSSFMFKHV